MIRGSVPTVIYPAYLAQGTERERRNEGLHEDQASQRRLRNLMSLAV